MNKKMKSLLFGLGSVAAVAAPVATLVACGGSKDDNNKQTASGELDLTGAGKSVWHSALKDGVHIADGTNVTYTLNGTKYSVVFNKAQFEAIKQIFAKETAQEKDFLAISMALVGGNFTSKIHTWVDAPGMGTTATEKAVKDIFAAFYNTASSEQPSHVTSSGVDSVFASAKAEFLAFAQTMGGHHQPTTGGGTNTSAQTSGTTLPTITAPTAHTLSSANVIDLSKGADSWHSVIANAGNGGTQIADGTKVGFISSTNGLAYEVSFNKSILDKLKAMINATTIAQEKDFVIVLAAAVAGTMDELHIKAALSDAASVAIIKAEFDALVGKATTTHNTTTSSFDGIKNELVAIIK